jgi:hypothetical protein
MQLRKAPANVPADPNATATRNQRPIARGIQKSEASISMSWKYIMRANGFYKIPEAPKAEAEMEDQDKLDTQQ